MRLFYFIFFFFQKNFPSHPIDERRRGKINGMVKKNKENKHKFERVKNRKRFLSATRFEWSSILIKNPLNTITDEFWPERGKLFHFLHESGYDIWKFHLYHLYARNIFHRSILLHWVIKKKKRNESIIQGILTKERFR